MMEQGLDPFAKNSVSAAFAHTVSRRAVGRRRDACQDVVLPGGASPDQSWVTSPRDQRRSRSASEREITLRTSSAALAPIARNEASQKQVRRVFRIERWTPRVVRASCLSLALTASLTGSGSTDRIVQSLALALIGAVLLAESTTWIARRHIVRAYRVPRFTAVAAQLRERFGRQAVEDAFIWTEGSPGGIARTSSGFIIADVSTGYDEWLLSPAQIADAGIGQARARGAHDETIWLEITYVLHPADQVRKVHVPFGDRVHDAKGWLDAIEQFCRRSSDAAMQRGAPADHKRRGCRRNSRSGGKTMAGRRAGGTP